MATADKSMTTLEFARASGIPAAAIPRLIRQGKLKAGKKSGKWMIPQSQLDAPDVREWLSAQKPPAGKVAAAAAFSPGRPTAGNAAGAEAGEPPPGSPAFEPRSSGEAPLDKSFSIAEFSAITYLTEKGVAEWLKIGRIKGRQLENGVWRISADNLKVPDISRLLRK